MVEAMDTDSLKTKSEVFYFIVDDLSNINHSNISKHELNLYQNYPNPFNPSTQIIFSLPESEHVFLEVYNTLGQNIRTLINRHMPAGSHNVMFNANTLPSGIYYYRIHAGKYTRVKKMLLLR